MKILITDANYKNSIAIQRELSSDNAYFLYATDKNSVLFAKKMGYCKGYFVEELETTVHKIQPDLIIPIGGESVKICSEKYRHLCLLPSKQSLDIALNKDRMLILNTIEGVNYPECKLFSTLDELEIYSKNRNCVVKSSNESIVKFDPIYIKSNEKINNFEIQNYLNKEVSLLVQEMVKGIGRGFFCIAKDGEIITYYMHERIRELPITGGSSTAAKSIYCEAMFGLSKKIIEYLNWSGPLMIEYKYDAITNKYWLIELNPKFWGSLDLSYSLGLNFGKTLINAFQNTEINKTLKSYEIDKKFYWVLDGDLFVLLKTRKLKKIREYFAKNANTNLFENFSVDIIKLLLTIKKLFKTTV